MKTLLLATLALAPLAAVAADGRIPVSAAGQITTPGDYYLTRDISVASGYAIGIFSGNVTLDLNGHTISAATGSGWAVYIGGTNNVRVTGGLLTGGTYGLQYNDTGSGGPPNTLRLDHLRVTGASNDGVYIAGNAARTVRAVVENNEITPAPGNCQYGLVVSYMRGGRLANNLVSGCTFDPSNGVGLALYNSNGVEVTGNTINDNSEFGVLLQSSSRNSIHHNVISGNIFGIGLFTSDNNSVDWNFITGNTGNPIYIGSGNTNIYSYNRYTGNSPNTVSDAGSGNISGGGNCAPSGCS
jgi:parallel beta-helix repeat protein